MLWKIQSQLQVDNKALWQREQQTTDLYPKKYEKEGYEISTYGVNIPQSILYQTLTTLEV